MSWKVSENGQTRELASVTNEYVGQNRLQVNNLQCIPVAGVSVALPTIEGRDLLLKFEEAE